MDKKLPIYTNEGTVKKKRKKEYLQKLNEIYPNLPKITLAEYERIRERLDKGDQSGLTELSNKSLYRIVDAVAEIYARHDIDEILPIEEAISYAICQVNSKLNNFTSLPFLLSEYLHSTINFIVFRNIAREYNREASRLNNLDILDFNNLAWKVDKEKSYQLSNVELIRESFTKSLERAAHTLTQQEKEVLIMRFGLKTGKEMSSNEIGKKLGLTRARIHEVLGKALRKLRDPKNAKYIRDYNYYDMEL